MDIAVENLTQVFGDASRPVVALDRVTHTFPSQRFTCILGPSGCGKSTMAQIIGGIEPFTSGSVTIGGKSGAAQPLGTHSVMVWQHLNLFPWRTVIDNVAFGLEMQGGAEARTLRTRPRHDCLGGLARLRAASPAATVRRNAPARGPGAGADHGTSDHADGRTVRRFGRPDQDRDAGRTGPHLRAFEDDHSVRHTLDRRGYFARR